MLALPDAICLRGRRILVTGAASGIGQATAGCLARLGAELVITDRNTLDETRGLLEPLMATVEALEGDITDEACRARLLEMGPYHALVGAAGVYAGTPGMNARESFDFVIDVNVRANLLLASACIRQMIESGGGCVVLVGSIAGRNGGSLPNDSVEYATYAASKGAVHTLVRSLSRYGASHNVRVNGVAPGIVATPLSANIDIDSVSLPMRRVATADEVGWPIALLCTAATAFVTGAILDVNGGMFIG